MITWFLFFIPVNVKSCLHALLDDDGFEDKEQALDSQSYANGSAKSACLRSTGPSSHGRSFLGMASKIAFSH